MGERPVVEHLELAADERVAVVGAVGERVADLPANVRDVAERVTQRDVGRDPPALVLVGDRGAREPPRLVGGDLERAEPGGQRVDEGFDVGHGTAGGRYRNQMRW